MLLTPAEEKALDRYHSKMGRKYQEELVKPGENYSSKELRLAIKWFDIIWNKPDLLLPCVHCLDDEHVHVSGRCLFQPTRFEAAKKLPWRGKLAVAVNNMAEVGRVFAAAGYKRHFQMAAKLEWALRQRCNHSENIHTQRDGRTGDTVLIKCHDCGWPWKEEDS